jgi:hypothetical protein
MARRAKAGAAWQVAIQHYQEVRERMMERQQQQETQVQHCGGLVLQRLAF